MADRKKYETDEDAFRELHRRFAVLKRELIIATRFDKFAAWYYGKRWTQYLLLVIVSAYIGLGVYHTVVG